MLHQTGNQTNITSGKVICFFDSLDVEIAAVDDMTLHVLMGVHGTGISGFRGKKAGKQKQICFDISEFGVDLIFLHGIHHLSNQDILRCQNVLTVNLRFIEIYYIMILSDRKVKVRNFTKDR